MIKEIIKFFLNVAVISAIWIYCCDYGYHFLRERGELEGVWNFIYKAFALGILIGLGIFIYWLHT